jgi:hypothetical protein
LHASALAGHVLGKTPAQEGRTVIAAQPSGDGIDDGLRRADKAVSVKAIVPGALDSHRDGQ